MGFTQPSEGARFKAESHNGALLIIKPLEVVSQNTEYGVKTAVRATVDVIEGPGAGAHYGDALLFGNALVPQIADSVGELVLGRLGQGAKKAGQKPPWKLGTATAEDERIGEEFLAKQDAPF